MEREIRVVQVGLGPIGSRITRAMLERGTYAIVGAVDSAPEKVGLNLGQVADLAVPLDIEVAKDVGEVLKRTGADVAVVTTTSDMTRIKPLILEIISHGVHVVSTCEELAYPWLTHPGIASEIDACAQEHGVSVLSTGVNPGFLMDFLPLALSGVCQHVRTVRVERIQDAQHRRIPFQKKIGAGLTLDEFSALVSEGTLRHVGLTESIHMVASAFGWELTKTEEFIEPATVDHRVETPHLTIERGRAVGVEQMGYGYIDDERVIELVFRAAVGEPESYERILMRGTPDLDMRISGGINGDIATAAIVVNAIPTVIAARPGLRTMADMQLISYFAGPAG